MSRTQTRAGTVGYRSQLDRARRFHQKIQTNWQGLEDISEVEFQDMMFSFFQHCWHIKDWLRHDPLASDAQKKSAVSMVHRSAALRICRDLCNGTKHLSLDRPSSGAGAKHEYVDMNILPGEGRFEIDCMIDDGHGTLISGKQVAKDCMGEWERILGSQGLATAMRS